MSAISTFCVNTFTVSIVKILLSTDDLALMMPLMCTQGKVRVGTIYVFVMVIIILAVVSVKLTIDVAASGNGFNDEEVSFWLSIVTGVGLCLFALYLANEEDYFARYAVEWLPAWLTPSKLAWLTPSKLFSSGDDDDKIASDDIDASPTSVGHYGTLLECGGINNSGNDKKSDGEQDDNNTKAALRRAAAANWSNLDLTVFFMSVCFDDFVVFLSLSDKFSIYVLLIGMPLGSLVVAGVCGVALHSSKLLSSIIERIPIPIVLFLLGLFIFSQAFYDLSKIV